MRLHASAEQKSTSRLRVDQSSEWLPAHAFLQCHRPIRSEYAPAKSKLLNFRKHRFGCRTGNKLHAADAIDSRPRSHINHGCASGNVDREGIQVCEVNLSTE